MKSRLILNWQSFCLHLPKCWTLQEGINTSGTIPILEMEKQKSKESSQFAYT